MTTILTNMLPVPSFGQWFGKHEKEIMKDYWDFCLEAGYNTPLEAFCYDLYNDWFYGNQVCLS